MREDHMVAAGIVADTEVAATEAEGAVEEVLQTLSNGVLGYRTTAGDASSTVLTSLFNELANRRSDMVEATLRSAADENIDFTPDTDGSVVGAIHRAWLKIESALVGDDAIVESVLKAEDYAAGQLEDALDGELPDGLRKALIKAAEEVDYARDQLKSWLADQTEQ